MKVDDYYVFWRYENNPNIYEGRVAKLGMIAKNMKAAKPGDKVEVVTCTIVNSKKEIMSVGHAYRVYPDAPNNEIGRKNSLTRAIKVFDRTTRAKFWEAYRNMTKIPKW